MPWAAHWFRDRAKNQPSKSTSVYNSWTNFIKHTKCHSYFERLNQDSSNKPQALGRKYSAWVKVVLSIGAKNFRIQKIFFFLNPTFFQTRNCFGSSNFFILKCFWTQFFFYFDFKFFLDSKFLQIQIFFRTFLDLRLVFCLYLHIYRTVYYTCFVWQDFDKFRLNKANLNLMYCF